VETTAFYIKDVRCAHCARAITDVLLSLPGVSAVRVEADTGYVEVTSEPLLCQDWVRSAVAEAGYSVANCSGP